MYNRLVKPALIALLALPLLLTLPALALTGDAGAVEHFCGLPTAQNQTTSFVTGHVQYDLYYGNAILHFEPTETGWSYTGAWKGNLPISKRALEVKMPCFGQAMEESANARAQAVDPTIAAQSIAPAKSEGIDFGGFGIPFFWLILGLIVVILLIVAWPTAVKPRRKALGPEDRPYRKPDLSRSGRNEPADPDRLDLD